MSPAKRCITAPEKITILKEHLLEKNMRSLNSARGTAFRIRHYMGGGRNYSGLASIHLRSWEGANRIIRLKKPPMKSLCSTSKYDFLSRWAMGSA